jgi:hypothetical protein
MTDEQAFRAMIFFLERYFERTQSDDVGALLGDLQLLDDGLTADPAVWPEWLECTRAASQSQRNQLSQHV